MLCARIEEQESVSLVTTKKTAVPATLESGLVLEDTLINPTRVETWPEGLQIKAERISRPWDTSWCSKMSPMKLIRKPSLTPFHYLFVNTTVRLLSK